MYSVYFEFIYGITYNICICVSVLEQNCTHFLPFASESPIFRELLLFRQIFFLYYLHTNTNINASKISYYIFFSQNFNRKTLSAKICTWYAVKDKIASLSLSSSSMLNLAQAIVLAFSFLPVLFSSVRVNISTCLCCAT